MQSFTLDTTGNLWYEMLGFGGSLLATALEEAGQFSSSSPGLGRDLLKISIESGSNSSPGIDSTSQADSNNESLPNFIIQAMLSNWSNPLSDKTGKINKILKPVEYKKFSSTDEVTKINRTLSNDEELLLRAIINSKHSGLAYKALISLDFFQNKANIDDNLKNLVQLKLVYPVGFDCHRYIYFEFYESWLVESQVLYNLNDDDDWGSTTSGPNGKNSNNKKSLSKAKIGQFKESIQEGKDIQRLREVGYSHKSLTKNKKFMRRANQELDIAIRPFF